MAKRKELWKSVKYEDYPDYVEFRKTDRLESVKIYYKDPNFVDLVTHEVRKREPT